jgi:RNA polymerase sigma-70 factor (ECF subfamily)
MTTPEPLRHRQPSDAALVQSIAAGDLDSLGVLYDRHELDVRRVLGRFGLDATDIDDVIQFTFLQVIRAAPKFDPRFSVRSWLIGIAFMMARRHRRSLRRSARRVSGWLQGLIERAPETPDETFAVREVERRVVDAFERLTPKRREAFVLVAVEGSSGEDAAAALGIPLNTLWTRLHHARQELRAKLGEDEK